MNYFKGEQKQQNRIRFVAILTLCIGFTGLHAQETNPAAGGNASGGGGSASYSVGQVVYITNTGTTGSISQGVQQPYEISVVTGIDDARDINLMISVYPNPTTDFLILKTDSFTDGSLSYQLSDINSKLLDAQKITGTETSIVMSNLVPSTYFLKITRNSKPMRTFKIIKN